MSLSLPEPGTELGDRVARRLRDETIGWITSVDGSGTPQPAPVWFLWRPEDSSVLLYSMPTAKRLARLRANPRTAFHLNDAVGDDVVVLLGDLVERPDLPGAADVPEYEAKYGDVARKMFGSSEEFAARYSVPLLFVPERFRGH
ncbi:hypothetical protein GCM10022243_23510 [Saccharothrix violaceirubra]|uniref:PPOX class probable F420-dependent enzyme n=1 Tax=Saccharothrix violaceirubra TaxID=413306 RepID=A0A7W7T186_9PSEU|nr:TIGR03667 family PPOX class F420-dependent oxidoreductase [Saccharothrix violaceirubra]MBB4964709.1 PPOX class probable F420-dependent enzyme [Saccharothrix violaceirubra]